MIFIFILFFSILISQDSDCQIGIVYPEVKMIEYFDPYLPSINAQVTGQPIDDETQHELDRLAVFFHDTFIEVEDEISRINFLPLERYFQATEQEGKTTLTIKLPRDEAIWRFHDDKKVFIEDIYYSMLYAIKADEVIPELYKNLYKSGKITSDFDVGQIQIKYKNSVPIANLYKHFKELIVLPSNHTKTFIESSNVNRQDLIEQLKKRYTRQEVNSNGQLDTDLSDMISSGPFYLGSQHSTDRSTTLNWFENYKNRMPDRNIDIVKIKINELKTYWDEALESGDINIAPELVNSNEDYDNVEVGWYESFKVTSLIVNYKNRHLKNQKFREALAHIIDKEDIVDSKLNGQALIIDGPFAYVDNGNVSSFFIEYDILHFKKIMNDLNYELRSYKNPDNGNYTGEEVYYHPDKGFAKLDLLCPAQNFPDYPSQATNACKQIRDDLINYGIKVRVDEFEGWDNVDSKIASGIWDLYWYTQTVDDMSSVLSVYSLDGKNNRGSYEPSNRLNQFLNQAKRDCYNPIICKELKESIFLELAKDYANIYLWSPSVLYGYNAEYFDYIDPEWVLSNHIFFNAPHKLWKLNDN